MIECYRYVHLTHRNLYPTIMSISIFDELNNQCFMTARTTFLTSRLKSANNNRGKYCLIFQVVRQLSVILYSVRWLIF